MKLAIQRQTDIDPEGLRALLLDALDELAGPGHCLLEPMLAWEGHPLLLADADARPVLVSFDLRDSSAALLNGLQACDRLTAGLAWVNQVYPALKQREEAPRLIVVTAGAPPGAQCALAGCAGLELFSCEVLSVNDSQGVLLERRWGNAPQPRPTAAAIPSTLVPVSQDIVDDTRLPALNEQESAYFQQL